MSIVQTEWWCLEIPEEWSASVEDDCVTVSDCDGVGDIDITVVCREDGVVDENELQALASDIIDQGITAEPVEIGNCQGLLFEYVEEDEALREWYLARGGLFVYITYSCDADNRDLDVAAVDAILQTLVVVDSVD